MSNENQIVKLPKENPLVSIYNDTDIDTKRILQILSVIYEPISLKALKTFFENAKIFSGYIKLITKIWKEDLIRIGLITSEKNEFRCSFEILEVASRDLVESGNYGEIANIVLTVLPKQESTVFYYYNRSHFKFREFRINVYLGDFEKIDIKGFGCSQHEGIPCLADMYSQPFSQKYFEKLPRNYQFLILQYLHAKTIHEFDTSSKLNCWSLIEKYFVETPAEEPEVARLIVTQYILKMDFENANLYLSKCDPITQASLQGWLHCLQNNNDESLKSFNEALTLKKKTKRLKNPFLEGFPALFFTIALLRSNVMANYLTAQKLINMQIKSSENGYTLICQNILKDYIKINLNELKLKESYNINQKGLYTTPWEGLFCCIILTWLSVPLNNNTISYLKNKYLQAKQLDLLLYTRECEILLKEKVSSPSHSAVFITQLFKADEKWVGTLKALSAIIGENQSHSKNAAIEKDTKNERMTWRLSIDDDCTVCEIKPRMQTKNAQGLWTKGTPISLKRLHENISEFDYLTPIDVQVCKHITKETTFNYSRYPETFYSLTGFKALFELKNHPHFYWEDQPEIPVEIEEAKPVLEVNNNKKDILLSIKPFPKNNTEYHITKEGFQRLIVTHYNQQLLMIAKLLGEQGLLVPYEAKEVALTTVASISPLLTIHSDFEGKSSGGPSEVVKANSSLVLQLNPLGEGLSIDCFVRPFGEKGPLFQPGIGANTVVTIIDGKTLQTTRVKEDEILGVELLKKTCPLLDINSGWHWELIDADEALETLLHLQEIEKEVCLEWPKSEKIKVTRPRTDQMKLIIKSQQDWFSMEGNLILDNAQVITLSNLFDLLDGAGRFIRLDKGAFLTLTAEMRKKIEALKSINHKGRFHGLAVPLVQEIVEGMEVTAAKQWKEQLKRLNDSNEIEAEIPNTLQAELRDYQIEGYKWLTRLSHWGAGACLADDMGLGKTIQAIAILLQRAHAGPALVIAPTSVCMNWMNEVARFAPILKVHRFGLQDREKMLNEAGPFDLIICSYGLLNSESKRLIETKWNTVILDEAQAIKNTETKRSKAAFALHANFKIATTGTPIENHLGELWSLFQFLNPGLLGTLEQFNQKFAIPIEHKNDSACRQRLKQLIRPFILRRLKSDVLKELPSRTEIIVHVEQSPDESALYEALRQKALKNLQDSSIAPEKRRFQVLAEITRLRLACCHPKLIMPESTFSSAKLNAFNEILIDLRENHHKALVFSQFVKHLDIIREFLDKEGVPYQYLDGSTPETKRISAIDAFQAGQGDLFLISLKAGGSGLNLTAADYVIHMDPWWNPAVEDQASDRAHRIGQKRPVTIYRMVTQNTIEDKIVKLHASKRDLADSLLEDSEMSARMTLEDMINLLNNET